MAYLLLESGDHLELEDGAGWLLLEADDLTGGSVCGTPAMTPTVGGVAAFVPTVSGSPAAAPTVSGTPDVYAC